MSKSKDTFPELIAQKILNQIGIAYSTHVKGLPGTPDIVIEEFKIVSTQASLLVLNFID